jgi:hypothetical protein
MLRQTGPAVHLRCLQFPATGPTRSAVTSAAHTHSAGRATPVRGGGAWGPQVLPCRALLRSRRPAARLAPLRVTPGARRGAREGGHGPRERLEAGVCIALQAFRVQLALLKHRAHPHAHHRLATHHGPPCCTVVISFGPRDSKCMCSYSCFFLKMSVFVLTSIRLGGKNIRKN